MFFLSAFPTELLVGLLAAFAGSFVSYLFLKSAEKTKLTLEFHKEWSGTEMSKIRRQADDCITKYPSVNYKQLRNIDPEGSVSVYIIMRFFQRLWNSIKAGTVNNQQAAGLFYDFFLYWYFISYEKNLVHLTDEFIASQQIADMHNWVLSFTSPQEYQRVEKIYRIRLNERIETARKNEIFESKSDDEASQTTGEVHVSFEKIFKQSSVVSIKYTKPENSLHIFEQLKVVEMKELGHDNNQIFASFNDSKIITSGDITRYDELKKYIELFDKKYKENTIDYFIKLKGILQEQLTVKL